MPYGNFYVGKDGFLYKKMGAVGNRRNFSLGLICNQPTDINNKYVSGSGVSGAVSSNSYAIRRKMIRNSGNCTNRNCSINYFFMGVPLGGSPVLSDPPVPPEPPVPTTYTVTYDGNTSTEGSVPTDESSPYSAGSNVTVLGNTGSLVKTSYQFAGWNTAADGSGTNYVGGNTFTINANTTLYAKWTLATYTVTYDGNTSTEGSVPTDESSPYSAGSNVTVLGNTGSLVKTSYQFAGWNTAADGSGTNYVGGNTFTINANTTLYAQWTLVPSTYTVTYLGNTNTSGTPPIDGSSPYIAGYTVIVLGASISLVKVDYQFAGWNTLADGSGTNYVGGDTFAINANTTLYANWIIGGVRLFYTSGTGGSGTAPSRSGTYYTAFSTQPVVDNTGPFTNANGYTFSGWNTLANGTGTSYPAGSQYIMPGGGVSTLHAQWINPATTYTLTYNAGTGGSGSAPASPTSYSSNSTATILGNTGPYTNSDTNKIFYGWNTAANGTGTSYQAGSTRTMTANTILYAQWVSATPQYTVTYHANGATGGSVPATTTYPSGVQVPILGQGSLTKPGYAFLGWNGSPTGAGSVYAPGYTFTSKTATTLYALWAPGSTIKNCGGGTASGGSGSAIVTYSFPYAQIIKSSDTITIYTTALLGTSTTNYGLGAAPFGIISIASNTVITQTTIQINVNTSYSTPADDYNYAKTITNGSDVTYWPSGATISSITYSTQQLSNTAIPTYSISTTNTVNGCGLAASSSSISGTTTTYSFFNQSFTINFSDSTSTFIATSPNNAFYASNNALPTPTWATIPRTSYPYALIVPDADNALTTITIIPSSGSKYVSPLLPDYTVEYSGNGNTSGTQPIPQYMNPYISGTTSITLRTNSGGLAKDGLRFDGWNTAADGSGTNYAVSATYNGTASLLLYAKWV